MPQTYTTFTELWNAWGPLLATIFGGMTIIIVYLARRVERLEERTRCANDNWIQKYIALLERSLEANATQAQVLENLSKAVFNIETILHAPGKGR